jgi:hypothetical protein
MTSTSTSAPMPSSTCAPTRQLARAWTRYRTAHLYRQIMQRRLPLSKRVIAPTQRRRRPPVLDWAYSISTRADKRAHMRTASSPNWLTNAYVAHDLPRSPTHKTRYAKCSLTAPWKSSYTPPTRRPLVQRSPESHPTCLPAQKLKPGKLFPTSAREQVPPQQPHAPREPPNRLTQCVHH